MPAKLHSSLLPILNKICKKTYAQKTFERESNGYCTHKSMSKKHTRFYELLWQQRVLLAFPLPCITILHQSQTTCVYQSAGFLIFWPPKRFTKKNIDPWNHWHFDKMTPFFLKLKTLLPSHCLASQFCTNLRPLFSSKVPDSWSFVPQKTDPRKHWHFDKLTSFFFK